MDSRTSFSGAPGARRSILSSYGGPPERRDRYWLHLVLFVLTLASTAFTVLPYVVRPLAYEGAPVLFSIGTLPVSWLLLGDTFRFAVSLLFFLTVHEFGHYFAARRHQVATSLPYYIPTPFIGIGTLGAVIRIREVVPSLRKLFDIGVAGPLAGFAAALGVLLYALATLPPPTFLFDLEGHEALKSFIQQHGRFPREMPPPADPSQQGLNPVMGQTLLYWTLSQLFPNVPPMYEMYHYPMLFAGWLGLFFTALNLMPVGQLDGGHILYALVGRKWHARLARGFVVLLLVSMSIGFVDRGAAFLVGTFPSLEPYALLLDQGSWFILAGLLYPFLSRLFGGDHRLIAPILLGIVLFAVAAKAVGPALTQFGYFLWIVWCILLVFLIRVDHPPVLYPQPLTPRRRLLGILSLIIFVLCFSFRPIYVV